GSWLITSSGSSVPSGTQGGLAVTIAYLRPRDSGSKRSPAKQSARPGMSRSAFSRASSMASVDTSVRSTRSPGRARATQIPPAPRAASRCAARARPPSCPRLLLTQRLRLEEGAAGDDHVLDVAVHHGGEIVARQSDAVVGQPILRKVVGADLLAAVAGSHLRLALRVAGAALLLLLHLVQPRAKHLQRHGAVLDLRLLLLALHHHAAG